MQKYFVQRWYFTCQSFTSKLIFLMSIEGKEYHQKQLVKHCKVCGKVVKGYAHSANKEHRSLPAVAALTPVRRARRCTPILSAMAAI